MYGNNNRGGGYNQGGSYQDRDNTNRGMLFPRRKTSDKSPDLGGDIEIGKDLLDYIVNEARHGGNVKVSVIAYRKQIKSGTGLSLVALIPRDDYGQQPARQPAYGQGRQQQMFDDRRGPAQGVYTNRSAPRRDDPIPGDLDDEIPF